MGGETISLTTTYVPSTYTRDIQITHCEIHLCTLFYCWNILYIDKYLLFIRTGIYSIEDVWLFAIMFFCSCRPMSMASMMLSGQSRIDGMGVALARSNWESGTQLFVTVLALCTRKTHSHYCHSFLSRLWTALYQ